MSVASGPATAPDLVRRRGGRNHRFVVAGDAPGLAGQSLEMLSPHPIGRLTFDGVRVEPADVLGEVGGGFAVAMRTLDLFVVRLVVRSHE